MKALHRDGYLKFCGYIPHNRYHNKKCGDHEHAHQTTEPASVSFTEYATLEP